MTDVERGSQSYDSHQALVKRFWYYQTKEITRVHHAAQNEVEYKSILYRKSDIWRDSRKLALIENELRLMSLVRWRVFGWFYCAAVSATLLNLPNCGSCEIVGMVILLLRVVLQIGQWFKNWADPGYGLETYERLLRELRYESGQKIEIDSDDRPPFNVRFG
jgi:hypothetical protein